LLPALRERHTPLMAYSPIDGGRITRHAALGKLAASCGASAAQLVLAWLLRQAGVMAIPKAGHQEHLLDNWGSQQVQIPQVALESLEEMFPLPKRKGALAMR